MCSRCTSKLKMTEKDLQTTGLGRWTSVWTPAWSNMYLNTSEGEFYLNYHGSGILQNRSRIFSWKKITIYKSVICTEAGDKVFVSVIFLYGFKTFCCSFWFERSDKIPNYTLGYKISFFIMFFINYIYTINKNSFWTIKTRTIHIKGNSKLKGVIFW